MIYLHLSRLLFLIFFASQICAQRSYLSILRGEFYYEKTHTYFRFFYLHIITSTYYADIDAVNLVSMLTSNGLFAVQLDTIFTNYYSINYRTRFTAFVGSQTQENLTNSAKQVIKHYVPQIFFPLSVNVTNNQYEAIADAFATKIFFDKSQE